MGPVEETQAEGEPPVSLRDQYRAPLREPAPLFKKLDEKVIEEERMRLGMADG